MKKERGPIRRMFPQYRNRRPANEFCTSSKHARIASDACPFAQSQGHRFAHRALCTGDAWAEAFSVRWTNLRLAGRHSDHGRGGDLVPDSTRQTAKCKLGFYLSALRWLAL